MPIMMIVGLMVFSLIIGIMIGRIYQRRIVPDAYEEAIENAIQVVNGGLRPLRTNPFAKEDEELAKILGEFESDYEEIGGESPIYRRIEAAKTARSHRRHILIGGSPLGHKTVKPNLIPLIFHEGKCVVYPELPMQVSGIYLWGDKDAMVTSIEVGGINQLYGVVSMQVFNPGSTPDQLREEFVVNGRLVPKFLIHIPIVNPGSNLTISYRGDITAGLLYFVNYS